MKSKIDKIVLAYSGGLDTSVILRWLIETYHCEVICFSAELGQGDELATIEEKGLATGAKKVVVEDLREEFVEDYVFPMLRANAVYEGGYLLGTSIARPLIAKKQIEVAASVKANCVAHGATGKGNDQVRFELAYYALNPDIRVIAPWREWDLNSRQALIDYAKRFDIPVPVTKERPYSSDRNLFHISFEGGILEDPAKAPPDDMFLLSVSPEKAPDKATLLTIGYEKGNPVSVDGKKFKPHDLLQKLNEVGGKNGIGRTDIVENRFVGMKSRGVYETPGGTILHVAHKGIEALTMDREVLHLRDSLIPRYAELVYYGFWFSPERRLLQHLMDEAQGDVTGSVTVKLYRGSATVVGRTAPKSLYHQKLATFEADDLYRQADAEGFIKLQALRLRMRKRAGFS